MNGMAGLAAIQSRIAQIEQITARFDALGSGTATAPLGSGGDDFASSLAAAQAGAGVASGATYGRVVDATPAEIRDVAAKDPKEAAWALDFLGRLGMPKTRENVRVIVAWQLAEGTEAAFNPLATTRDHPGATDFNSVGVKNYPDYEAGMQENIEALHNGLYDNILAALAQGNDANAVASAIENSRWGTGGLVLKVLASRV
jgi:hypothetical protein